MQPRVHGAQHGFTSIVRELFMVLKQQFQLNSIGWPTEEENCEWNWSLAVGRAILSQGKSDTKRMEPDVSLRLDQNIMCHATFIDS